MPEDPDNPTPTPGNGPRFPAEPEGQEGVRELVLVKNGQRYAFRCLPGEEASLLERLGDLVRDPDVDLTWFDAAVLSHQVGVRLGSRLHQMQKPRV